MFTNIANILTGLILTFVFFQVPAIDEKKSIENKLSARTTKIWYGGEILSVLGSKSCRGAYTTYTFNADSRLVFVTCKNGFLTTNEYVWSVTKGQNDNWLLVYGDKKFIINFVNISENKTKLTLVEQVKYNEIAQTIELRDSRKK